MCPPFNSVSKRKNNFWQEKGLFSHDGELATKEEPRTTIVKDDHYLVEVVGVFGY